METDPDPHYLMREHLTYLAYAFSRSAPQNSSGSLLQVKMGIPSLDQTTQFIFILNINSDLPTSIKQNVQSQINCCNKFRFYKKGLSAAKTKKGVKAIHHSIAPTFKNPFLGFLKKLKGPNSNLHETLQRTYNRVGSFLITESISKQQVDLNSAVRRMIISPLPHLGVSTLCIELYKSLCRSILYQLVDLNSAIGRMIISLLKELSYRHTIWHDSHEPNFKKKLKCFSIFLSKF